MIRARSASPATSRPTSVVPPTEEPRRDHGGAQLVADADPRQRRACPAPEPRRARRPAGGRAGRSGRSRRGHLDLAGGVGQHGQPVALALRHDPDVQERTALDIGGGAAQVQPRQHLAHRAGGDDPAGRQQHHGGGEPRHLVQRVADEQDRDARPRGTAGRGRAGSRPCGPGRARPGARRAGAGAGRRAAPGRSPPAAARRPRACRAGGSSRGPMPSRSTTSSRPPRRGRGARTSGRRAGCGAR